MDCCHCCEINDVLSAAGVMCGTHYWMPCTGARCCPVFNEVAIRYQQGYLHINAKLFARLTSYYPPSSRIPAHLEVSVSPTTILPGRRIMYISHCNDPLRTRSYPPALADQETPQNVVKDPKRSHLPNIPQTKVHSLAASRFG